MSEVVEGNGAELPVGEFLRSARQSRGLTLDEASRVTRIGKNYLAAIEDGNFEKLPNAAYIKGFLRLYAGYLSLSGDQVLERYERGIPLALRPKTGVKPERPVFEAVEKASLGGHGRWLLPLILLGLVLLATLFFSEKEQPARPTPHRPQAPRTAPVAAPVLPQASSAAAVKGAAAVPAAVPALSAAPPKVEPPPVAASEKPAHGVILRLRFNRDSWLSITIDGSISQRYDLKAGDIIEWKGTRSFVLDLGDGAAAVAEFNGQQLKALGEPGRPAHLELKGNSPGN